MRCSSIQQEEMNENEEKGSKTQIIYFLLNNATMTTDVDVVENERMCFQFSACFFLLFIFRNILSSFVVLCFAAEPKDDDELLTSIISIIICHTNYKK